MSESTKRAMTSLIKTSLSTNLSPIDGEVYCRKNRMNGKVYIGQCRRKGDDPRWKECILSAKKGERGRLYEAIRKYGKDAFEEKKILYHATTQYELDRMETFFIILHQSFRYEYGYNMVVVDGSYTRTEAHRELRRQQGLVRGQAEAFKQKMCALGKLGKGKKQTADHIRKRVESRQGFSHSEETRQAISKANKGKPSYLRTEEHKKLMSIRVREAKRRQWNKE